MSWDVISSMTDRICSTCNSFKPDTCSDCYNFMEEVFKESPSTDYSNDFLRELVKFNNEELADCFYYEDYDRD